MIFDKYLSLECWGYFAMRAFFVVRQSVHRPGGRAPWEEREEQTRVSWVVT